MKTITIYELMGLIKDGQAPEQIKYFDNRSKYEREDFEDGMKSSYLAAYKELQELKEGKK